MPGSLCAQPATELAALLRRKEVSAREVLRAHLDRVAEVDPQIGAIVALDVEGAMRRAGALDDMAARRRLAGPLHGVPVAIKDVFDAEGLATTHGSRAAPHGAAGRDAVHVARLRAAGAVIFSKTNTAEFAYGAQTTNPVFGTTRNPHDLTRSVSGSSGGAAAALAAGMAALADGSDLGGSIRAPAGLAGVVGLRPTSRAVPLVGAARPFDGLNVPGPMARTVQDVALMLEAMAGAHPGDPCSRDLATARGLQVRGLRVAWCLTPGGAPIAPAIRAVLEPVRTLLEEMGAQVEEADPGLGFMLGAQQTFRDWSALLELGETWRRDPNLLGPEVRRTLLRSQALTASDLARAEADRKRGWEAMRAFYAMHDLCLWPINSQPPYGADEDPSEIDLDETATLATPLLGIPALAMPIAVAPAGFPVGLQLIGPSGSDRDLLAVARQIERAVAFPGRDSK